MSSHSENPSVVGLLRVEVTQLAESHQAVSLVPVLMEIWHLESQGVNSSTRHTLTALHEQCKI